METLTVGELKARFSEVLGRLREGEEIAISYGKKRERVAVLVPYAKRRNSPKRTLGPLKGQATCVIHDGFEMTDDELLAL